MAGLSSRSSARRRKGRSHDRAVAGAAAQMAGQNLADLRLGCIRPIAQQRIERHQDARRAEAALQAVIVAESTPAAATDASGGAQALDGANVRAFDLHCKRNAGAGRRTVDLHGAGAADAVLAADMRTGRAESRDE